MAQKGAEAQVNFETKRRKSSHLKCATYLSRTQQARGPHCYSEEWGQCLGRPAPASTPSPAEVHDYMVPLTSPFGFVFYHLHLAHSCWIPCVNIFSRLLLDVQTCEGWSLL